MKIISHRGNLQGKIPNLENNPIYIEQALNLGFDVEIDVWYVDGKFYLGHDAPTFLVDLCWFYKKPLWCHAKNQEALEQMLLSKKVSNCFWHETDKMTITSNGTMWLYPDNYSSFGITVWLGEPEENVPKVFGVCTDYPLKWKRMENNEKDRNIFFRL